MFELNFWGFLLVIVQIRDQFIRAMRDSDPRVKVVFVRRRGSDLNSVLTVQATGCNFQYGSNFGCSLESNLVVQLNFRLLAMCTHDLPTAFLNFENSSVSFRHEKLSDFKLWSGILHQHKICSICLVVITFQIRSPYLCSRSSSGCAGSSAKGMCVFITLGSKQRVRLSFPQQVSLFYHGRSHILSHIFCDCSVNTELIYSNNCKRKNSFNRSRVGATMYWQFSTAFAFKRSSGQWTRGSEYWVCAFCKCQNHLLCNYVPFSLWTVCTNKLPLFLRSKSEDMTIVLLQISLHKEKRVEHLIRILFIVFRSPWDVVEHRHEDHPSHWLFLVLRSILTVTFGLRLQSCSVVNPGKIFHSNSIGSPSIASKVLYCDELLNHFNLSSHAMFGFGFSFTFPRHNTESENT